MQEQFRRRHEDLRTRPGGSSDIFSGSPDTGGMATVCHGPYSEELPVADMSVQAIRERFGDRLDIDPESRAVIDGREADEATILRAGQLLTFVRRAGEKGLCPLLPTRAWG